MFETLREAAPELLGEGVDPELIRAYFIAVALASVRMSAFMYVFPAITRLALSGFVRTGVVIAISLILIPPLARELALVEMSVFELGALSVKEAVIGLALGVAFGVVFWGIEAAGNAMDFQRGASVAQSIDPTGSTEATVLGNTLGLVFVAFFWISGGMLIVLEVLYGAYEAWPILAPAPAFDAVATDAVIGFLDRIIRIGVIVAGPLMIAMFVTELALALTTRFAPQMNIFILALPIKCGVVAIFLPLYLYFLFQYFGGEVADFKGHQTVFESLFQPLEEDLFGRPLGDGER